MISSPVLALHILCGSVGFLSGAVAISLRKGARGHALSGNAFVISMLTLAVTGMGLAIVKSQPGNILGGALTLYLVFTAWRTARQRDRRIGIFDWGALLVVASLAATDLTAATVAARSSSGMVYGYSPGPFVFTGSIALLSAIGDARLLLGRVLSGTQRIARHLWRMCFALFIASGSIFLARQQLFPTFMRKSGALYALTFFPLIVMLYWLVRIRLKNKDWRITTPPSRSSIS